MMPEHLYSWELWFPLVTNLVLSVFFYFSSLKLIPTLAPAFIKANLFGIDLNKNSKEKIPEAFGVVSGCMFLLTMFLFIPVPFGQIILNNGTTSFLYSEFIKLIAALLSICCMLLLGFADDVLDLRWKHKLLLPTVASLPLLMVYYVTFNSTSVVIPKPFQPWFGRLLNLGIFYYVYMGMLAVFCTNAINILAGVNGLEAGQSVIIAISIMLFNLCELTGELWRTHQFSLYFIVPFIFSSLALLKYNWYPSRVFVGDTFCYFAGMTFAVVGILGHFSKTVLLFFLPQIANFLYSTPQLFHVIPCPRHRIPKLSKAGFLEPSTVQFSVNEIGVLGHLVLKLFDKLSIAKIRYEGKNIVINNLTLINFLLIKFGPLHESHLTIALLCVQVLCTGVAFIIRYPLASLFYDIPLS
ncbi:UDP-N-acetylglucosamine--dolichyl-phosphate N-acetylglucosaminephosphotransferase isoform X1 [Halyomorpha halys]|uniref:UDP-N-acetylglucosamine--dolichyl-phosphate N-acetylglucosaminephosphotransferase isoform X1 n=1 Tax=Halyomorpha halys TaxID=286706 RepID=UPI0006D4CA48|nr:UDP-N-acetylglucosamine--dolichyl-phosphate N-acetylglucosaminephosphotransferase [Halyomorpha halys]